MMIVRNPAVAGTFYPLGSTELKNEIKKHIAREDDDDLKAAVSPHAGYEFCGKTMGKVYSKVPKADTYIILGPNHYGYGAAVATTEGMWKTPLGSVEVDSDFVKLLENTIIKIDPVAHRYEHSIEVQLPWLQYKFGNIKFVPISINSEYFDKKLGKEIADILFDVIKAYRKKVFIIASSDFTHYGPAYNYVPFSGTIQQILKKIKERDIKAAEYISNIMPETFIDYYVENRMTICGYAPISVMLFLLKHLGAKGGEIVDYSTSFDISKDRNAIVSYCGIVLK